MRTAALLLTTALMAPALEAHQVVALPGKSPLVTFRFVFRTGAAYDPAGKAGVAALTAAMLSEAGSKSMTYKEILDAMFPMAISVRSQVDKEMITFSAETHVDNLDKFYALFRQMLLEPGWREDDLTRLRDDAINFLRVSLRGNNEEELGKEALYLEIYKAHPYGHHNAGVVSALQKLTMADLQEFYMTHFTQDNLIIGIAGGYPAGFLDRVKQDFEKLPKGASPRLKVTAPKALDQNRVFLIEKDTRSVAISFGYPIEVTRSHPDFPALLLVQTYFGQHRDSGGRLFERMRQIRGLNYGDYAYIEYFPRGMFQFTPDPNLARGHQIFQIWIRPVEPPNAMFALRLAVFELEKLIKDGIPQESFERTRNFLAKNMNLLMKTKDAQLGYMIDSMYYGIPEYSEFTRKSLSKLTPEDVNRAIRKHLRADRMQIVIISADVKSLQQALVSGEPTPITYNSPKPEEILAEDKIVALHKIPVKPDAIEIVPVGKIFE